MNLSGTISHLAGRQSLYLEPAYDWNARVSARACDMRVVHCMRAFSPLSQTFIYDYVVEMARQGVDVHVLTDRRENLGDRPFGAVHLTPLPSRWTPARIGLKLQSLRAPDADRKRYHGERVRQHGLANALRRLAPDIVHAHFGPEAVHLAPVARELGIPLIATFYGFDVSRLLRDPAWSQRYAHLWQHVTRIVVLSKSMLDALTMAGCPLDKCVIVHLGKDLARHKYFVRTPPLRRFLSVGRLVEKKGHLDVIEAMALLRTVEPDVELTIVGDGPQRSEIEALVRLRGLQDVVSLAGPADHATVMHMMSRADAFVLASRTAQDGDQEGTPTVIIEAQALGLPVVSTRHAGIPEQIPSESHWLLAPERDVEGIALRMRQLRRAAAKQIRELSDAGRRKMELEFNLSVEVARLRRVYDESLLDRALYPR